MIRLSVSIRSLLMFLCMTLFGAASASAQCSIELQGTPIEGCEPYLFKVKATHTFTNKTAVYWDWNWGDGKTSNGDKEQTTSHLYVDRGSYTITLVITFDDGSKCTTSLANPVLVYGLPTAIIVIPPTTNLVQCFQNNGVRNSFKFTHNSQRSKDNHPIVKYNWNFGDGDTSSDENPTHSYDSSGTYVISLQVWDAKGCYHSVAYPTKIRVLADIKANLTAVGTQGCSTSTYTLKNITDTLGMNVKRYYWDFESDGIWDDSTKWTDHKVTVVDDSQIVTLRLVNRLGCLDDITYKLKNTIISFKLSFKDSLCWEDVKDPDGKGATFIVDPIPGVTYFAWNFDDAPHPQNVLPFQWVGNHRFINGPKNYSVTFRAIHPICGVMDTCVILHVKGPQASIRISSPTYANNYVPTRTKMPPVYFKLLNEGMAAFPGSCDSIPYAYFIPVTKTVTKKSYCNVPLNETISQIIYCNVFWKTPYWCDTCTPHSPSADTQYFVSRVTPLSANTTVNTVSDSLEVWAWYNAFDPLPKNPYFRTGGGPAYYLRDDVNEEIFRDVEIFNYLTDAEEDTFKKYQPRFPIVTAQQRYGPNMHDTNLYTCKMPNLVRFSNFSVKYRLYNTLDDRPLAYKDNTWWDIMFQDTLKPGPNTRNIKLGWPYAHTEEDWTLNVSKETVVNLLTDLPPPPLFVSNGWIDSCRNPTFPFASDSLRYFWDFGDGDPCTSSVNNKNWDCQYSTLVTPYHLYKEAPDRGCTTVQMWAYDDEMGCEDKATQLLRQTPPDAWWDRGRNGYSMMTWEIQHQNPAGGTPEDTSDASPHVGLRLGVPTQKLNCTGPLYRFSIQANGQIMPTCGVQKYWIVFDSAATVIDTFCKIGALRVNYRDYGFLPRNPDDPAAFAVRGISKGYPTGAPDDFWNNLPWLGDYWWAQGDTGCKTIGFVVQNGTCFDTAWYHDYICFTRLSPHFSVHRIDTNFTYVNNNPRDGAITDVSVEYVEIGKSTDADAGQMKSRKGNFHINPPHRLSQRPREREGTDILLLPLDRNMPRVKKFFYVMERREFPSDNFYYHYKRPGDLQRGLWPDSASLNPFRVKPLANDTDACRLWARTGNTDSVTAIQDTIYYTKYDLDHNLYTVRYFYDIGGNIIQTDTLNIDGTRFFLLPKEYNTLKKDGKFILSYRDMRARPFGWKTSFGGIPIYYKSKTAGTVPIEDTAFFLDFIDPAPQDTAGTITAVSNQNTVITMVIAGHSDNSLHGKKVAGLDLNGVKPTSLPPFYLQYAAGKYELHTNAGFYSPVTGIGTFSPNGYIQTEDDAVTPSRYERSERVKDDEKEFNDGNMRFSLHDSVRMHVPFPGFYTVQSIAINADGCNTVAQYHFINGHFAKFWIKGKSEEEPEGDSIICANDTVRFKRTVRYWTTNCPPLPSGIIPDGCVSGPETVDGALPLGRDGEEISVQLYPWDFQDPVAYRKTLLPSYEKSSSYRDEYVEWNYGDHTGWYKEGTPGKFGEGYYVYKTPGIYDVTMRSRDSLGYYTYTSRRKLINVIEVDADFVVNPLRDTHSICAPKNIVYKDRTKLLGSDSFMNYNGKDSLVADFGKFFMVREIVAPMKNDPTCYEVRDTAFLVDSIIAWRWTSGQSFQDPVTRTETDSMVFDYRANGQYDVELYVVTANEKPRRCTDEEIKQKYIRIDGPKPSFELLDSVGCVPFTARVRNTSTQHYRFNWYLGDGTEEVSYSLPKDSIVKLTYKKPGRYRVTMIQQDSVYDPILLRWVDCTAPEWPDSIFDDTSFWVTVYPFSPITISGDTVVCPDVPKTYTASSTYGEFVDWKWTTSDNQVYNSTNDKDSTAIFSWHEPGNYWIAVHGTTDKNCEIDDTLHIRVDSIKAIFTIDTTHAKVGRFVFNNISQNGKRYRWTAQNLSIPGRPVVGFDEDRGDMSPKEYEFADLEPKNEEEATDMNDLTEFRFRICLTAYSPIDCPDDTCQEIVFPRAFKPWNVFTPDDGDGKNDVFNPHIKGETDYHLQIFNRWGEKVFTSTSSDDNWNGRVNNSGAACPAGTYYYVWRFTLVGGVEKTIHGTVTLLRD